MKLSMRLTMDGLVRALRWRGIELLEPVKDERKEEERDDERQHGTAEGSLSRPLR